ncbi:hypothetical protein 2011_scaffold3_00004 [Bacteriophage sp.]|nr:hypothetical protein 2011_scaffold3_00004 [Bacteriophage sp.]
MRVSLCRFFLLYCHLCALLSSVPSVAVLRSHMGKIKRTPGKAAFCASLCALRSTFSAILIYLYVDLLRPPAALLFLSLYRNQWRRRISPYRQA